MSRISVLWLLFSLGTSQAQECPPPPPQRDLVILPDTAHEELLEFWGYAAVNELQINSVERILASEATPVLIELSIWKRFAKAVKDKPLSWLDEKKYEFYLMDPYMLCIPLKWKALFPATGFHLQKGERVDKPFQQLPRIGEALIPFFKTTLMLIHVYTSLVKTLHALLVPSPYSWNIILFGHGGPLLGSYQSRVAGIPFREFQKLLKFLKTKITTNIFLYSTCYAGSKWLLKIYTTKGKPDTYPFPIILTGITEAPVSGYTSRAGGIIRGTEIYKKFFQEIKTISLCRKNMAPLGLIAGILLQALRFDRAQNRYALTTSNNILQIRWPQETDFHAIILDNIIQSAQQSKKEPTIVISSDALVIDIPVLQKNIRITKPGQAIISGIPNTWYLISSVTIANTKQREQLIKQLFDAFTTVMELSSPKRFLIDQIRNAEDQIQATNVIISLHSFTPSSLIKRTDELFYVVGEQGYRLTTTMSKPELLRPSLTMRYLNLYAREEKRLKVS